MFGFQPVPLSVASLAGECAISWDQLEYADSGYLPDENLSISTDLSETPKYEFILDLLQYLNYTVDPSCITISLTSGQLPTGGEAPIGYGGSFVIDNVNHIISGWVTCETYPIEAQLTANVSSSCCSNSPSTSIKWKTTDICSAAAAGDNVEISGTANQQISVDLADYTTNKSCAVVYTFSSNDGTWSFASNDPYESVVNITFDTAGFYNATFTAANDCQPAGSPDSGQIEFNITGGGS